MSARGSAVGMNVVDRVPTVSAIVSTHNRCASLRRTLESLWSQELSDGCTYEVIIVDNNSTDATRSVVEGEIARGFPALRYLFEPRQGVSFGRNAGIAAARAPILAFTDDDNQVGPQWVATIKRLFDSHPELAAVGGKVLPKWPDPVPMW